MKSISVELKAHYAGELTTICTLWKLTRVDGAVFGFTDNTRDIEYLGVVYKSSTGYSPSAVETSSQMNVDNLEVEAILDSSFISEQDILAGLWDYAQVIIAEVNYMDLTMGHLELRRGYLGEVQTKKATFVAELRGLMQNLQQTIGELYSASCRASVFDTRCRVSKSSWLNTTSVTAPVGLETTTNKMFNASALTAASDHFNGGLLEWLTGNNAGYKMEVKYYTIGTKRIELVLPMPYVIVVGDTFDLLPGCNKSFGTCKDRYNNVVNFRGEPHLPGMDKLMKPGGV